MADHLILAGGGHTHALLLLRWSMKPHLRPQGLITLISRDSTTIYSGMFPGVISRRYILENAEIDLRILSEKAGVAFILGEINRLDCINKCLFLSGRPPIGFTKLSLNVGSEINQEDLKNTNIDRRENIIPIRPFKNVLAWIESKDNQSGGCSLEEPITVVGSGLGGLEIIFALRKRWPHQKLFLQVRTKNLPLSVQMHLKLGNIPIIAIGQSVLGSKILCTAPIAPAWIKESSLPVDGIGRVLTSRTLQVINHPYIFASGDCAAIRKHPRPSSGVWAVRASKPLAKNIERLFNGKELLNWRPQVKAIQILGMGLDASNTSKALLFWGDLLIGPHSFFLRLKERIDRKFIDKFKLGKQMRDSSFSRDTQEVVPCRGCAAKLASNPLRSGLKDAGLQSLSQKAEDAVIIGIASNHQILLQSVDGFPSLISDPWLNARITALHACSDLWARGASVCSAQAMITLPFIEENLQKELLTQVLKGLQSALHEQGAELIGGHTLQSRSKTSEPSTLGIEIGLTINGSVPSSNKLLNKGGLQPGDDLLLSRGIGSGILFAAAMMGQANPKDVDAALSKMNSSQHLLLDKIFKLNTKFPDTEILHACTDITGFGLLGHLGEMIGSTNIERFKNQLKALKIVIQAEAIPTFSGVPDLLNKGFTSSLAPANRSAWNHLSFNASPFAYCDLRLGGRSSDSKYHELILELLIDPQTCGPLAIACDSSVSSELENADSWIKIGSVEVA